MEQHKPDLPESEVIETYAPWQIVVLQLLEWGAWGTTAMAIVYALHS